jgi:dGTPase
LEHPLGYVKDYPAGDPLETRAADVIAGMTDSYALALYEKVFFPRSWPIV